MSNRVFVFVRGGLVNEIFADDPLLDVRVVDYDCSPSSQHTDVEREVLGTTYDHAVHGMASVW